MTQPASKRLVTAATVGETIAEQLTDPTSEATAVLNATYAPRWKPTTAYLAGDKVISPDGDIVAAVANFTSGASYSAANWTFSPTVVDKIKTGKDLPTDIVILAGQSNAMDKSDWITSGPIDTADPRVMNWNITTGVPETIPADHSYLGLYFAQSYLREFPNRRLIIIPAAVGDTGLVDVARPAGTWDRMDTSNPINLYNRMVTAANAAKAYVGGGAQITAVLWSQGEADARTTTQAAYATKLDDLISAFRTAMSDTFNKMPFVVGSFVPEVNFYDATLPYEVPYALEDTPRRKQFTSYVYGPKNFAKYNENVHYSVAGQRERGRMFVEGLRKARSNSNLNSPNQPYNLRVQRSGDDVLVTWDAPYSRVTSYAIQTSIDKGATWADQSPPRPMATEYRTTCPASTPFWVRIKSTNEVGSTVYTLHEPFMTSAPAYVSPQERYRAVDLSAGAVTSWPSVAGAPVMAVNAGAPTVTTDTGEKVLVTNGTSDRMSVGASGLAWQTASALVKLPAASTGEDYIFGPTNTTNGLLSWDSSTGKLKFTNGDATKVEVAATAGWHVVTVTLGAAGAASVSCDKVRVAGTVRNELPPAGIRVAGHFSSGQFIAASWSELALWNRVLTVAEIEQWVDAMHNAHPSIYP